MNIADKTVLMTGAKRGIGQALTEEALRRRARRVYAGTREPHGQRGSCVVQGPCSATPYAGVLDLQGGCAVADPVAARAASETGPRVHAVLTGPTDTDMTRVLNIPKSPPLTVARAILDGLDGLDDGEEDIFLTPVPIPRRELVRRRGQTLERQNAELVA